MCVMNVIHVRYHMNLPSLNGNNCFRKQHKSSPQIFYTSEWNNVLWTLYMWTITFFLNGNNISVDDKEVAVEFHVQVEKRQKSSPLLIFVELYKFEWVPDLCSYSLHEKWNNKIQLQSSWLNFSCLQNILSSFLFKSPIIYEEELYAANYFLLCSNSCLCH